MSNIRMKCPSGRVPISLIILLLSFISALRFGPAPVRAAMQALDHSSDFYSLAPVIAPDGHAVALIHRTGSVKTLMVLSLASGLPTTLATWSGNDQPMQVDWSNNSQSLVVTSYRIVNTITVTRLDVLAADGTQSIAIAELPVISGQLRFFGFTSNNQILYQVQTPTGAAIFRATISGSRSVSAVRLNPDNLRPDNCTTSVPKKWIVCSTATQVFTIAIDGPAQHATLLMTTTSQAPVVERFFSPHGSRLLIRLHTADGDMLYSAIPNQAQSLVRLNQQAIPNLSPNPAVELDVAVTPDEQSVIFRQPQGLVKALITGPASSASLLVPTVATPGVTYGQSIMLAGNGQFLILTRTGILTQPGYTYDPQLLGVFTISINSPTPSPIRLLSSAPERIVLSTDQAFLLTQPTPTSSSISVIPVAGPQSAGQILTDSLFTSVSLSIQATQSGFALMHHTGLFFIPNDGHQGPTPIFTPNAQERMGNLYLSSIGVVLMSTFDELGRSNLYAADIGTIPGGFATTQPCAGEGASNLRIPVALESAPVNQRSLSYHVSGGTAQANDYTLLGGGTLTFAAGERTQSIPLQITADVLAEGTETLEIMLESSGDIALQKASITISILEQGSCQMMLPIVVQS